ncbi:MAG: gluconate 2-dehydrogenase subunit 3 family protein, partial [Mycobacterium sp.]
MPFRTKAQRGITPQGRGRFPGFDVLDQAHRWDDVTAGVVLARLTLPKMLSFFTPHEVGVAEPMLDLLMDQDSEPRVPVLALIDGRLSIGETDGWHYDD